MKLSGAAATRFCSAPTEDVRVVLIHGPDESLVSDRCATLVTSVLGDGYDPTALVRLAVATARKDPASVSDALRARGFFSDTQVVLIEGGTDGLTASLKDAILEVDLEQNHLVVCAGSLPARSSLRKLFEARDAFVSLGVYPEAIGPQDFANRMKAQGMCAGMSDEALALAAESANTMSHGAVAKFIELLCLAGAEQRKQLDVDLVASLVPREQDADTDALVAAAADGAPQRAVMHLRRALSSGVTPVQIVLSAARHFRTLHRICSSPGGIDVGLSDLRPPLYGPRRTAIARQARRWGSGRTEMAMRLIYEADKRLRSSGLSPEQAIVERCVLRLSMMSGHG